MSFSNRQSEAGGLKEVETKLARMWSSILNDERGGGAGISRDDKFLDVGGDSLLAIVCISRMREAFGVEFTIEEFFFEDATVSTFAKSIIEAQADEEGRGTYRLAP